MRRHNDVHIKIPYLCSTIKGYHHAAGDQTVVRFNGDTYYSDYVITAAEKKAVQNVLDAFVALGGDLDNP
jgi:hypothetical protein